MWYAIREDELYHHGIKGQKWGVRRFQNQDGTLTADGRKRYRYDDRSKTSEKLFTIIKSTRKLSDDDIRKFAPEHSVTELQQKAKMVRDLYKGVKKADRLFAPNMSEKEFLAAMDAYNKAFEPYLDALENYQDSVYNASDRMLGKYKDTVIYNEHDRSEGWYARSWVIDGLDRLTGMYGWDETHD